MFHHSTQKKHWTFADSSEILDLRKDAHLNFISNWSQYYGENNGAEPNFLTLEEEASVVSFYGSQILELCKKFQPPSPPSVYGTALVYFKRFYLNTSVMDYHPREIVYLCIYLAAKVDEFNVSVHQFTKQVASDSSEIAEFVISNELLLMQKLHFHLTVHNPFRPLEGLLIDVKARVPEIREPEKYRPKIDKFVTKAFLSDVMLAHSPSQIALAALRNSIGNILDKYIIDFLSVGVDENKLIAKISQIEQAVASFSLPRSKIINKIEEKLSFCRNHENNPFSEHYQASERQKKERKEHDRAKKYEEHKKREKERERELLGNGSMDFE